MKNLNYISVAVFLIVTLVSYRQARAFDGERVLLLRLGRCCALQAWPDAEASIVKEFSALNIQLFEKDVSSDLGMTPEDMLRRHAEAVKADAVILIQLRMTPPCQGSIHAYNPATGKTVEKAWPVSHPDATDEAMFAGLRAVDILRAGMGEPHLQEDEPSQPTSVVQPTLPPPDRLDNIPTQLRYRRRDDNKPDNQYLWSFEAGGGGAFTASQDPKFGGFELAAALHPFKNLSFGISGSLYLYDDIMGDSADANLTLIRAWLIWRFLPYNAISPEISLGGGGLIAAVKGSIGDNYYHERKRDLIGCVGIGTALALRITSILFLRFIGRIGMFISEMQIVQHSQPNRQWGHPFVEAGAMLALMFR